MTLKDKMKQYNFWISLVSAVLLVARIIAGKFNYEIDSSLVMDVTTGLCGIFVILGLISAPQKTVTKIVENIKSVSKVEDDFSFISPKTDGACEAKTENEPSLGEAEQKIEVSPAFEQNTPETIKEVKEESSMQKSDEPAIKAEGDGEVVNENKQSEPETAPVINDNHEPKFNAETKVDDCYDVQPEGEEQISISGEDNPSQTNFFAINGVIYDLNMLSKNEIINLIKTKN